MRLLLFLVLVPGVCFGQTSWWDRTVKAGTSIVSSVRAQGPAQWKRLVRAAEWRVAKLEREVASMRLDERRRLATELWRMRSALDLTAGLDDSTVRALTGIDPSSLRSLRRRVTSALAAKKA